MSALPPKADIETLVRKRPPVRKVGLLLSDDQKVGGNGCVVGRNARALMVGSIPTFSLFEFVYRQQVVSKMLVPIWCRSVIPALSVPDVPFGSGNYKFTFAPSMAASR